MKNKEEYINLEKWKVASAWSLNILQGLQERIEAQQTDSKKNEIEANVVK